MAPEAIEIHRLHLADVTPAPHLPWTRPGYPVFGYLVLHRTGPIVVDTGIGAGNEVIDDWYAPVRYDIDDALARHGVRVDDVTTVVTSHLHFDHCGQNHRFGNARLIVQRAEVEAAKAPMYTVAEWAFPAGRELTVIDGDFEVAPGVQVVATPGHTPGHQSVVVDERDGARTIICCQACWDVSSFDSSTLGDDGADEAAGARSAEKLRGLRPDRVLFSHDTAEWRAL